MFAPQIERLQYVDKPWGHEAIFGCVDGLYVGKVLFIRGHEALSLQYHEHKDEMLSVQRGNVLVEVGTEVDHLTKFSLSVGDSLHIPPRVLHRLMAEEDSEVLEVSTAQPGWRHDVVRLEDRYGRAPTTRP